MHIYIYIYIYIHTDTQIYIYIYIYIYISASECKNYFMTQLINVEVTLKTSLFQEI